MLSVTATPPPAALKPLETTLLPHLGQADGKPLLAGSQIQIESKIFESPIGGMFLGTHLGLQFPVVVRVLRPEMRASMKNFDRFLAETRRLARVRHPNVATLIDAGEVAGHPYSVTEYVCGVPLIERLKTRPLSALQALQMLMPIAEGLCELWRQDTVHRAVSPHYIYLQCEGPAKLDLTVLRKNYTDPQFKAFLGPNLTPYWSPEEIRGDNVTPAADMWGFGATLYHAVTGHAPFEGASLRELQASVLLETPRDPSTVVADLPRPLCDLLMRLLSKKEDDRFQSAEAFMIALGSVEAQCSGPALPARTEILPPPTPSLSDMQEARVGDVIGHTKLMKRVGAGAFGVVYLARHTILDIDVAIKLLPLDVSQREPGYIEMFLREARTAARIRNPNVIGVFSAGNQDGQYYLIMEYAPGGTVWDRMQLNGGRLSADQAVPILRGAARGLSAAERMGIVHRDIKPDNLMFGGDGEVKIADLGLAKRRMSGSTTGGITASVVADQLTMKGDPNLMAGTPAYMAPEMALDPQHIDTRADLYSLGVTGYHMLTGQLPFDGAAPMEVIMKHVTVPVVPPHDVEPTVPRNVSEIVMKLLEKKPQDRYASAELVAEALSGALVSV